MDHFKGDSTPYIPSGLDTSTIVLISLEEFVARAKLTHVSCTSAKELTSRDVHAHSPHEAITPTFAPPAAISFSQLGDIIHNSPESPSPQVSRIIHDPHKATTPQSSHTSHGPL
ncbi:hypothetical protein AMTR_s00008p00199780 [Amborella trichopoda]|uniref:Uncharacterized protein n=1 Tax=Amborella trichopoda TaxID=13333 RepID=W1NIN4_AMBTC|nr:hypothetical protein AMTR_s00008p00199780 [Amborella trichopoda]